MMKRNSHFTSLESNYLFPEITLRKLQFQAENPLASVISLGIGDTTQPISTFVSDALSKASKKLSTREGYSGYGPEQGIKDLRETIALQIYQGEISADDIFISDGAKCDLGRLQALFGGNVSIAVQDPAYPVYIDGSLIQGVQKIVFLPCTPENDFFPDLTIAERTDLIYFCSPNNPTGAVATKQQLERLVQFAQANRSIIIFDAAYANYIQDPLLPRSIYEIEGAQEVAIEVNSFSKLAGFTGVRLGWTVVPEALRYDDGASVKADWNRLISTIFNGASNIAQSGGVAVFKEEGLHQIQALTAYYLENAQLIKEALEKRKYEVYGGVNAPYLWVRFQGQKSWDVFQQFLEQFHLVTTPGSGFGPAGEGFLRLTAFGKRETVLEAIQRFNDSKISRV
ncbi:MAG: LL-diaminopimelate aminotransferase [Parachlamydiaceae bacterium]